MCSSKTTHIEALKKWDFNTVSNSIRSFESSLFGLLEGVFIFAIYEGNVLYFQPRPLSCPNLHILFTTALGPICTFLSNQSDSSCFQFSFCKTGVWALVLQLQNLTPNFSSFVFHCWFRYLKYGCLSQKKRPQKHVEKGF